jgi:4-amino-4-deoxy-L-arabinose transferase-like glycosyltransferase
MLPLSWRAPALVFAVVAVTGVTAELAGGPAFRFSVGEGLNDEYDEIAANLVVHGRYAASLADPTRETVTRAPVYPLYLAALFKVFGVGRLEWVAACDMVLHALSAALLTAVLSGFVASRFAVAGGLLFGLWPTTFYYAAKGSSETMVTLWLVVGWALLLALLRRPSLAVALALGAAAAMACLTRGSSVVLLAVALGWMIAGNARGRVPLGHTVAMVLVWALVMSPWWVRNARVTGTFVPFHTLVWFNAYHDDVYDDAHRWLASEGLTRVDWASVAPGTYPPELTRQPPGFVYPPALAARDDLAQEAAYRAIMLGRFREPGYLVRKVGRNAVDFWSAAASVAKARMLGLSSAAWLALLVTGLAFAWRRSDQRAAIVLALAVIAANWALYLPFFAIFRHSIPTSPFVAFVIAMGLARAMERRPRETA